MSSTVSVGDDAGDVGVEIGDEGEQAFGGGLFRLRRGAHREPDQRAVAAVAQDRVANQVQLLDVFIGDDPAAGLVPVDDDFPLGPFGEDVPVGADLADPGVVHRDSYDVVPDRVEPAAGVAVPRGVRHRPLLLALVVPDVEPDGVFPLREPAHQVFVDAQVLENLRWERLVRALPPVEQSRDGGERLPRHVRLSLAQEEVDVDGRHEEDRRADHQGAPRRHAYLAPRPSRTIFTVLNRTSRSSFTDMFLM